MATKSSVEQLNSFLRGEISAVETYRIALAELDQASTAGPELEAETGAAILGDKAAIMALEEGEDHGLKDYRKALDDLDAHTRDLVNDELLPLQMQSHRRMSHLKRGLSKS